MSERDINVGSAPDAPYLSKLAGKVEELKKEKETLEKKIKDLETRVAGLDELTYDHTLEKCTTKIRWGSHSSTTWPFRKEEDMTDLTPQMFSKGTTTRIEEVSSSAKSSLVPSDNGNGVFLLFSPESTNTLKESNKTQDKETITDQMELEPLKDAEETVSKETILFQESNIKQPDEVRSLYDDKTSYQEPVKDNILLIPVTEGSRKDPNELEICEDKPICPEEERDTCQCYKILRDSEEWKANVTKLLELLVMNAYGNKCPHSLIKSLMEPAERDQAIMELFNRTLNQDTLGRDDVSKDDISKGSRPRSEKQKDVDSIYSKSTNKTTGQETGSRTTSNRHKSFDYANSRSDKKNMEGVDIESKRRSSSGMLRSFAEYPPYPPPIFEGRKTSSTSDDSQDIHVIPHQSHSNKVDIVCPPGSRPIIHIPTKGLPPATGAVTNPEAISIVCCSPKNPCYKHR